ncbi:cytochrome c, class I [Nitrosococcus halophilus Nc 4]|uniref:Cytochrome c, class I n=1 Tax=Nitrosococcus halophilus (strain Nc4) TaxID=472759 RepID=D5BZ85_NITHN|nr:c-type cytochrome [Nitrosococcus halophilus]ADE16099.1 cytochrome c, class I [Nitrosococcus halophilus Nc 4]
MRRLRTIIVFLALLAVGGVLVAASGIIPIKASSGHWALTYWFLSFSMNRSIATHSMGIKVPEIADPALVLQGAGHYETGCRFCHGRPGLRHPPIPGQMTPPPPYLPSALPKWESGGLFYIVKHGVKFTGMPAWPAPQRDDEVWAMVAFLRVLPKLTGEQYEKLIRGEVPARDGKQTKEVPSVVMENCGRCHGMDGLGRGVGAFPRLAGQHIPYLYASLSAYARGDRHSGMMEPIATELSPEQRRVLARYYGNLPPYVPTPPGEGLAGAIARGEIIAKQGIPSERIPSCVDCHGPSTISRNPYYPVLAGQYFQYLVSQLKLFAKEHRGGTPYVRLMHPTAHQLTEEQIRDVARYYASVPALSLPPNAPEQ